MTSVASKVDSDEAVDTHWSMRLALPFFLITIVLTYAGFVLFGASQAGVLPVTIPYEVAFLAQFAPSGTAVYLAWRRGGRRGAKALMSRLVQWRVSPMWYVVALLTAPAMAGVVLLGNQLVGTEVVWAKLGTWPQMLGSYFDGQIQGPEGPLQAIANVAGGGPAWLTVLIFAVFAIIAGGLSEELGWRGHALSTLQKNYTSLTATLVIALYWGLWHIAPPPVWEMLFSQGIGAFLPVAGTRLAQYLVLGTPLCVLYTLIVNRGDGSILLAVLFHAAYNTTTITLFQLWGQTYFWEMILGFWVVGGSIVAANRSHFFTQGSDG